MKKIFLLASIFGIGLSTPAICGNLLGADGYSFGSKEFTRSTVEVTFVTFKSKWDMIKYTREHGIYMPNDVQSVSTISKSDNKCTIYTVDPASRYIPEQYGHELTHCIYGRWHEVGY